ncbi:MAG: vWA domain-containing protein [Chthoniobacteraceae bacterium]
MKTLRSFLTFGLAIAIASSAGSAPVTKPDADQPVVQLAILLDTSNSMDGLIAQAKTQLWNIVNEFATAKQDGKAPRVQVALYEYGNTRLKAKEGWVRQVVPLTDDLDQLSEQLFSLKTSGGNEYCGWVIRDAVKDLAWDSSSKTYKAIFVAGNEPFTQGEVNYVDACKGAIEKGIIVNTIHCGSESDGVRGQWKDGASLADGRFIVINQDARMADIPAPQDRKIAELNGKLNRTYIAYGAAGGLGKARQEAQDANAASAPAPATVLAARVASKSSANYSNAHWDLVDRAKEKDFDFSKLKTEELPEELRKLSVEERKEFIAKKAAERDALQKELQELASARGKFVAEKMKEQSKDTTLDKAVTTAVREQASKKGVTFGSK